MQDSRISLKDWLYNFRIPIMMMAAFAIAMIFGLSISRGWQNFFFTLSLSIQSLLTFTLPFIIFSFLFSCVGNLSKGALRFVLLLLPMICISNYLAVLTAYASSYVLVEKMRWIQVLHAHESKELLTPLAWQIKLMPLFSNDKALFSGCIIGYVSSRLWHNQAKMLSSYLMRSSLFILKSIFVPILPLFIFGFVLRMEVNGVLSLVITSYFSVFVLITFICSIYIVFLYGLANNFKRSLWLKNLGNMLPAGFTAFSTVSSAASLPMTLLCAEKNVADQDIVHGVVPATANTHLIGDCFAIPILAFMVLLAYGHSWPGLSEFLYFAVFFVLAKFAVAAVPSGGILVMLPVLGQHLGFNSEMQALIVTVYALFDPMITVGNVMGNGIFVKFFDTFYKKLDNCIAPNVNVDVNYSKE